MHDRKSDLSRREMLRLMGAGAAAVFSSQAAAGTPVPAQAEASPQAENTPGPAPTENIVVDASAHTTPLPHFWEQMFGSGHATLALRASYLRDLREVKRATGLKYVRFHGIFDDDVGVYDEDPHGNPVYNFSYVDQIYDGLLAEGVRPFVETSFMPAKLAARQDIIPMWYKPIVSPPKSYAKWGDLIRHFARHLVDRYGVDEVAQWYFEVWNEPNIAFWTGNPRQQTYFELYDHTARALKSVSPRLRVGGPATAAASWIPEFIDHVVKEKVPADFVSTHGYADDTVWNLFHTHQEIPMDKRVGLTIRKVHDQIAASPRPNLPLMWTEWNVPSFGPLNARDTIYVGAALANDIPQCDGLVNMMSFWTFSDIFEETGVFKKPFHGGFGLITADGIRKPSFNGFALLHRLGDERIANPASNVLVTRRSDGTLVLAMWNVADPGTRGEPRSFHFEFRNLKQAGKVLLTRLDAKHGNSLAAYDAMGKPRYPTQAQIKRLNQASELPPAENLSLKEGQLRLEVPVNGLYLLELPA